MDQDPVDQPPPLDEQLKTRGLALQPCPSWCAGDHFGPRPVVVHPKDGFFHYGAATTFIDDSTGVEYDVQDAEIRVELASWTPALDGAPGSAHVRVSDGEFAHFFTPDTARRLAAELTRLADRAETT